MVLTPAEGAFAARQTLLASLFAGADGPQTSREITLMGSQAVELGDNGVGLSGEMSTSVMTSRRERCCWLRRS